MDMVSPLKTSSDNNDAAERKGFNIPETAERLRNYMAIERARLRTLAGWFLRHRDFEVKYRLAYHLYDASEHVTQLRNRLLEMRAGSPNASVRPALQTFLREGANAPDDDSFLKGFYGVLTRQLAEAIDADLELLDPSGNANEVRLLKRMRTTLGEQLAWFDGLKIEPSGGEWPQHLSDALEAIGGWHGETPTRELTPTNGPRFERPATILFDDRITIGPLMAYEERQKLDAHGATIEQFKVFFNEFYAAALLASILYDAEEGDYPWEFFADFSRHFWDEVRHSEFGCIRLRELGVEPNQVNPVLFDESQGLPILHRVAYLTRGLEAYFMPRKPKRMREYEQNGDARSQLFADQDWSDEINHVRYGSRWTDHLLKEDFREVDDIIDEVKTHLSKVRGGTVKSIEAPF
ncbi:MAG: hypothetical protein SynsKO_28170 [Synoicihabitans sp.]